MKELSFYRSFLERLTHSWVSQPDKPEETPDSTLRALCFAAAGAPLSVRKAITTTLPELDEDGLSKLERLVQQRLSGIPLAHLTGRQHFMGLEFLAGPEALIPRAQTEFVGRAALAAATSLANARGSITAIDICTGSGNIALAIAAHEPRCRVYASDISSEAIAFAQKNAKHLGLEGRVEFRQGNMFGAFESEEFFGRTDLLTCNPPYIPSAKVATMDREISQHEPRLAFDGGALGVSILTRIVREAPKFLKPGSFLCFEVGLGEGEAMAHKLRNAKVYRNIVILLNDTGQTCGLSAQV
jgi:release factor glutamine methyltransferase